MSRPLSPLVDVICSVYNPKPNLLNTVHSVLTQGYRNLRLILIDDGSFQDEARRLISEIGRMDSRVCLIHQPINAGLTPNLHLQIKQSKAAYIARIDAGDEWLPDKLSQQIEFLEKNPQVLIVGTQCVYFDEKGKDIGRSWFAETHQGILTALARRRGIFEHSSIVFRAGINYRPEFRLSQDLDLYLRAVHTGRLQCLSEVLTRCEINYSGLTIRKRYLQLKYQNLAYQSSRSIAVSGRDIPLTVNDSVIGRKLWKVAQPFYVCYVTARTKRRGISIWTGYLLVTCMLYPPLAKDYLRRGLATFPGLHFISNLGPGNVSDEESNG